MALRKIRHLRPQQTSLNARKSVEPEGMVTRMALLKEDISYKPIQIERHNDALLSDYCHSMLDGKMKGRRDRGKHLIKGKTS